MPSPSTTAFPVPKSWDEFEEIVADVLRARWGTPHATRNGRSGQAQHGIDIYARGGHVGGRYVGAQCKRVESMTTKEIDAIVTDAESFVPELAELLITTTLSRDAALQTHVRKINALRVSAGSFPVEILFWEDICLDLAGDKRLLAKHFPGWSKLAADDREPEFQVRWIVGDELTEEAPIISLPPDTIDLLGVIDPYWDEELEYLRRTHAADAAKAEEFNALANRLANDPEYQRRWRAWNAPTASYDGTRVGIAVSLDGIAAKDVLIRLHFDEDIDVFGGDDQPRNGEDPLPEHPKLESERRYAQREVYDPTLSLFGSSIGYSDPWKHVMRAQRVRSVWASDQEVTIRMNEFSPRRTARFVGDEDSIVIASWARDGTRTVRWTADTANRSSTQTGELRLKIEPSSRPMNRRRQSFIGERPQPRFAFTVTSNTEEGQAEDEQAED